MRQINIEGLDPIYYWELYTQPRTEIGQAGLSMNHSADNPFSSIREDRSRVRAFGNARLSAIFLVNQDESCNLVWFYPERKTYEPSRCVRLRKSLESGVADGHGAEFEDSSPRWGE